MYLPKSSPDTSPLVPRPGSPPPPQAPKPIVAGSFSDEFPSPPTMAQPTTQLPNYNPTPPPVVPQAQVPIASPSPISNVSEIKQEVSTPPSSKKKSKFPLFFLFFLLLIIALVFGGAYAIAYEKVKIGNPQLENQVSDFVQGLSFTPKTPRYLLVSAARAHQKITRHSFDLSLAIESDSLTSSLGMNKADIQVKGAIDYTDQNNPKLGLNAQITKDFSLDIKKPDKMVYFRVNKFPPLLLTAFGFNQGPELDAVLKNWVSYDTSTLDTEARQNLDKNKRGDSLTNQFAEKTVDTLLLEKLLKSIDVKEEKVDEFDAYRLNLPFSKELLDELDQKLNEQANQNKSTNSQYKLSNYISDAVITIWIDKKSYYMRKLSTALKVKYDNAGAANLVPILGNAKTTSVSLSAVLKLSNFQEPVSIDRPAKSISYEEFFGLLMGQSQAGKDTMLKARDSARKADASELLNAIERFYSANQCYPWSWNGNSCSSASIQLNKGNFTLPGWENGDNLRALIDTSELKPQFKERVSSPDNPSSNRLFLIEYQWTPTKAGQVFICFEPESEAGRNGGLGRLSSASGNTGICTSPYSGGTSINASTKCMICLPQ